MGFKSKCTSYAASAFARYFYDQKLISRDLSLEEQNKFQELAFLSLRLGYRLAVALTQLNSRFLFVKLFTNRNREFTNSVGELNLMS